MLTQKQRLIGNYNDVHAFASAFYPKCLFKMLMIMQTQCCTTTISGSRTRIMHVTNVRFHHKNAPKLYIFFTQKVYLPVWVSWKAKHRELFAISAVLAPNGSAKISMLLLRGSHFEPSSAKGHNSRTASNFLA